jgi:excisionase family DNA binding protein
MSTPSIKPLAVSLREAAELVGLSKATLRRLAAAGRLRLIRVGGKNIVPLADIHRLVGLEAETERAT